MGEVTPLPENALSSLDAAEREQFGATTRVETLNEQLETEQEQRKALECNDELLIREDDVQEFHKRRIEVQKEKTDLPNRLAELASAAESLRRLAGELEWKADDAETLVERIPPRAKVTVLHSLIGSRGERASGVTNAKTAVDELDGQIADVQQEIDGKGAPVDVSKLAAVVKATREGSDIASRIKVAETESREAKAAIERRLKSLKPLIGDEQTLVTTSVPTRDMIQTHRDDRRNADQRMQACRERIRTAEQELARHHKAHERLAHDEDAIAPKDLADAREVRDSGWSLIRRRYVEGVSVPDDEIQAFTGAGADLTNTYEAAVTTADTVADRRFDNAQAAAQIALIAHQIAKQQELAEYLREEEGALAEVSRTSESAWKEMWAEASFEPLGPDLMLEWLATRHEILESIGRREAADRQLEALRDEESKASARILAELSAVAGKPDALDGQPLRIVMETATAVQSQHEKNATSSRQAEERLRKMKADAVRKATVLETAETAWRGWQTEWAGAVGSPWPGRRHEAGGRHRPA